MDKTGVVLSMLGLVKVLVGKDDMRDYRGARVKRTIVTAIECISGNGRYLNPMIVRPATTHRSNWTTFPPLGGSTRALRLGTPTLTLACSGSYVYLIWKQRNELITSHVYLYVMALVRMKH
jgi:hypothetical protein